MDKSIIKYNERIIEIKTAITLNRISKDTDFGVNAMNILAAYVASFDNIGAHNVSNVECLKQLYLLSRADRIADASMKDLVATLKLWYKPVEAAKKLGIPYLRLRRTYGTLLDRNYIDEKYIQSLAPIITHLSEYYRLALTVSSFVDKFNFPYGDFIKEKNNERTLELQFYLIYSKIREISGSEIIVSRFFENICNKFNISFDTIAYLYNNISNINRTRYNTAPNRHQFMQEYCNMFFLQGVGRGTVSRKIYGKPSQYLTTTSVVNYTKNIINDDAEFSVTYQPTISWLNVDKAEVIKFIELFYDFVKRGY